MSNIEFFIAANARSGNLIYGMSQAMADPIVQDGPWGDVRGGYCAGLAVRWMRLAYQGKDYVGQPGFSVRGASLNWFNGNDWQATIYQNKLEMYRSATNATRLQQAGYALGLGQMFLSPDLREDTSSRVNGQKLARVVKQSYGCYYVVLTGGNSAHAVAMRHAKPPNGKGAGVLHIFDANSGHYAWQTTASNWAGLIEAFLYFSDYDYKYPMGYLIGKATPPHH
jgi:hypothetical protein